MTGDYSGDDGLVTVGGLTGNGALWAVLLVISFALLALIAVYCFDKCRKSSQVALMVPDESADDSPVEM